MSLRISRCFNFHDFLKIIFPTVWHSKIWCVLSTKCYSQRLLPTAPPQLPVSRAQVHEYKWSCYPTADDRVFESAEAFEKQKALCWKISGLSLHFTSFPKVFKKRGGLDDRYLPWIFLKPCFVTLVIRPIQVVPSHMGVSTLCHSAGLLVFERHLALCGTMDPDSDISSRECWATVVKGYCSVDWTWMNMDFLHYSQFVFAINILYVITDMGSMYQYISISSHLHLKYV